MKKLSIVIPVYNEEKGIGETLSKLIDVAFTDWEIIVVNDGSTDKSKEMIKQYPGIKIVNHQRNLGYGAALKTGINHANYDLICITDADGTYPNAMITNLMNKLIENDLDMVVGARTGSRVYVPLVRRPAKWGIGKLANWVTGKSIPDINSGLRIFKKSAFMPFINIVPDGFSFTTTITLGMLSGGYKVEFIPIDYFRRSGKSKIRPIRDTMNFVKLILRIGLYFAPLKIFMPISIGLFLLAIGWGVFTKFALGELADVSSLIIAMTGFQVSVLAFIAELINHRMPNQYMK